MNSITFLNRTGDITLTWDETNRDKMIELVKKKMDEGFVFFTTKKVPLLEIYRKVKVTKRNIEKIDTLVIPDDEFDKMVKGMDDADIAQCVASGSARVAKRAGKSNIDTVKRLKSPEEVVENNSLALRPIAGG